MPQGYSPDVVLVMDYGSYRTTHLGKDLFPAALWVLEAGDDPQQHAFNVIQARRFDVVLSPDKASVPLYRRPAPGCGALHNTSGGHAHGEAHCGPVAAHWFTHWAGVYERDLVASLHSHRWLDRSVSVVTTCGPRGVLPNIAHALGPGVVNFTRTKPGVDHHRALSAARIVLNQAKYGEVTRRIFEAMAAGALVVTDKLHPLRGLERVRGAVPVVVLRVRGLLTSCGAHTRSGLKMAWTSCCTQASKTRWTSSRTTLTLAMLMRPRQSQRAARPK